MTEMIGHKNGVQTSSSSNRAMDQTILITGSAAPLPPRSGPHRRNRSGSTHCKSRNMFSFTDLSRSGPPVLGSVRVSSAEGRLEVFKGRGLTYSPAAGSIFCVIKWHMNGHVDSVDACHVSFFFFFGGQY